MTLEISKAYAGGSGLNTLVVINQSSPESLALGNYYCERRNVPPENVLCINWDGGQTSWNHSEFTTSLLNPLGEMLAARALTNQIEIVVLSMSIPFQTIFNSTNYNSTTSALFYGLKADLGSDPGATNSYAMSESPFPQAKPASAPGPSFLTTMITAASLEQAKYIVDQGLNSDGNFPQQPVLLAKSSDPIRNLRYPFFDNAIINTKLLDTARIIRSNTDVTFGLNGLLGYETGLAQFNVSSNTFIPGAIADNMTSYGGIIFGANGQTSLLAFLAAGAAGSYGTIAEPYADTRKFPDPMVYFYQARGFNIAESYYQSLNKPYLGLIVAEPLAAPFAQSGHGMWSAGLSNSVLASTAAMEVSFSAPNLTRPLHQIDLFVDGKFHQTLTNLPPTPGNSLFVALNGYPISYTVPPNATITTVASNLAVLINDSITTNSTQVRAWVHGDRIELQSITTNQSDFPFYAASSPGAASTGTTYRVAYLPESYPPRLIPKTSGGAGFAMLMEIPTSLDYTVQASTNLTYWQPIFTNRTPGLVDFRDLQATNYPNRFYRLIGPMPDLPPRISPLGPVGNGGFGVRLESQPGQPCALVVSTNQLNWSVLVTNTDGGTTNFVDTAASSFVSRFYRGMNVSKPLPDLTISNTTSQSTLVRIDNAAQPYTVQFSTNGSQWLNLTTNFHFRDLQATASSSSTSNETLTTFIRCSQPAFLTGEAFGFQQYTFFAGTLTVGAWAEFTITKTNSEVVVVGLTNQIAGISATNLAFQLYRAIQTNAALQGNDGLVAEDFYVNSGAQSLFILRARSPGYPAAQISVLPKRSSFSTGVSVSPSSLRRLISNASDLQPRNHLFITTGASELTASFILDTTQFPDGYHELTAVAYEGSSVRTQTRATTSVCISNTPLNATLTLLDLTNNSPATATYHIQVAANTNNVSLTTLYSTGGPIGFATNNPNATFAVIATNLWIGRHPFYATVETSSGQKFRTQTSWIRLQ